MCGKIAYDSKSEANKECAYIIKSNRGRNKRHRPKKDVKKLKPYLCPHCGKWHLTASKKRKF